MRPQPARFRPEPARLSSLLSLLALAAVVALGPVLLTSCSGGDEDEEKKSVEGLDSYLEKAETARDEAKAAGAEELFAEDFEAALEYLVDAEQLVEDGEERKAKSKMRTARTKFSSLQKKSESLKKSVDAAKEALEAAKKAREEAVAVDAATNASREFERNEKQLATYEEMISSSKDTTRLVAAARNLSRLESSYRATIEIAKENKVVKEKAMAEQKALEEWKKKAEEAETEKYASSALLYARQLERSGSTDLKNGQFLNAYRDLQGAVKAYSDAIEQARNEKRHRESLASNNNGNNPDVNAPPPVTPGAADVSTPDVDVPPDDGSGLPAGLSDEEIILAENIGKLLPSLESGTSTYDPATGVVVLNYQDGTNQALARDAVTTSKNISYKNPFAPTKKNPIPGAPDEPEESAGALSFAANTRGSFLIPIPLEADGLTFDYSIQIQTMDGVGHMGPIFLTDEKAATRWYANYCTLEKFERGNRKGKQPSSVSERNAPPNNWFDKKRPIHMVIQVAVPEDAPEDRKDVAAIKIFHDDEPEPSCVAPVKATDYGFLGWFWFRTKFSIHDLVIRGKINKEFAIEILKKKGVDFGKAPSRRSEKVATKPAPRTPARETPPASQPAGKGTSLADEFDY